MNFFEDGNENKFVHIDTIELNGNEYVVLVQYTEELPEIEDNEEEEELGVVFHEFRNRMDGDYYEDDED